MKAFNFSRKAFRFIVRYICKDPFFVFHYGFAYLQKNYKTQIEFFDDIELAQQIEAGKSIIRIGDGEVGLIHGRGVSYQKADKLLIKYLKLSIKEYSSTSPYIIAIPIFVGFTNFELIKRKVLNCWLPFKIEFRRIFPMTETYGDAHFFYYKNNFEKYLEHYLHKKKLIINTTKENIVIQKKVIEKNFSVLGWVEAKSPDPFDLFVETQSRIDTMISEYKGNSDDVVLILGSGPMSKALAYIYSKKGIQSLDVGKGFEHIYNSNNFEHFI